MSFPVTDRAQLDKNRQTVISDIYSKALVKTGEIMAKAEQECRKVLDEARERIVNYKQDWIEEDGE